MLYPNMHKNPCQKPHSVSKIRNSVVPCAFAIQHQSGTWRDSDEYGWSSKNVQTDWHPLPPLVDHNVISTLIAGTTDLQCMLKQLEQPGQVCPLMTKRVHGRCEEDIFCFVKEMQCEERTMEVYAVSKQLFWTFSAMLMHFQENHGRMICFFRWLFYEESQFPPCMYGVRMIWKYFSHVPFVVTQIRSEGPSFWSQAFLNFNSNALKVAKFRTPQLFGFINLSTQNTLLRVISTKWHVIMTLHFAYCLTNILTVFILTCHLANIVTRFLTIYLTYILTYLMAHTLPDTYYGGDNLFDIFSDILSDIYLNMLFDILFDMSWYDRYLRTDQMT